LTISQASSLYSLISTYYGGDGVTNFRLPNLMNRTPCNQGQGPGLSPRNVGQTFGQSGVRLDVNSMPAHNHSLQIWDERGGGDTSPVVYPNYRATKGQMATLFAAPGSPADTPQHPMVVDQYGPGGPHENRSPILAMTYCISLSGIFPSFPD
jgi:microcystin-dependent protein